MCGAGRGALAAACCVCGGGAAACCTLCALLAGVGQRRKQILEGLDKYLQTLDSTPANKSKYLNFFPLQTLQIQIPICMQTPQACWIFFGNKLVFLWCF
jgi:hypothetical protein